MEGESRELSKKLGAGTQLFKVEMEKLAEEFSYIGNDQKVINKLKALAFKNAFKGFVDSVMRGGVIQAVNNLSAQQMNQISQAVQMVETGDTSVLLDVMQSLAASDNAVVLAQVVRMLGTGSLEGVLGGVASKPSYLLGD